MPTLFMTEPTTYLAVAALMLVTGVIKMAVGGGGGPLLTPVAVFMFEDPVFAIVLMTLVLGVSDFEGLRRYWRCWDFSRLGLLPAFLIVGTVLGILLVARLPGEWLRPIIGLIGVVYGILHVVRMRIGSSVEAGGRRRNLLAEAGGGVVVGFFGTIANAGSILLAMFMLWQDVPKRAFMGNMVITLFLLAVLKIVGFGLSGQLQWPVVLMVALAYPFMFLGGWLGKSLNERLDETQFRNLLAGSVSVVGALLLLP